MDMEPVYCAVFIQLGADGFDNILSTDAPLPTPCCFLRPGKHEQFLCIVALKCPCWGEFTEFCLSFANEAGAKAWYRNGKLLKKRLIV